MKTVLLAALVACAGLLTVSAASGDAIRVTKVRGAGTLERVGGFDAVQAIEGLEFAPGSSLTTGPGSSMAISLGAAGMLRLGPSSRLRIGREGSRWVLTLSEGRSSVSPGGGTYRLSVPERAAGESGPRAEFRAQLQNGEFMVLSHGDEVLVESSESGGDSADVLSGGVFVGDDATGRFVPEGGRVGDSGDFGGQPGSSDQQDSGRAVPGTTYTSNSTLIYPGEDLSRPVRESTRVP